MTESELVESNLFVTCDREDCPVCKLPASTVELLMEGEL